jgi:hypothetical protein
MHRRQLTCLVTCLMLAFSAVILRLYNLTDIGIGGNDSILYFTIAEHWLNGDFTFHIGNSINVVRPVYHAYNAFALALFDHQDYALKVINALCDGANTLLVAYIASLVSRRTLLVFAATLSYVLLPMAIWTARVELPHTLSTFCTLVACAFLFKSLSADSFKRKLFLALCSGAAIGAAALTHEELIFIAAGSTLLLLWHTHFEIKLPIYKTLTLGLVYACLPFICIAALMFNQWQAITGALSLAGAVVSSPSNFGEKWLRFLWQGTSGSTSPIIAALYWLAVLMSVFEVIRKKPINTDIMSAHNHSLMLFCLWMPFLFISIFSLFFSTIFPRGLLPVVPLMLIGSWVFWLSKLQRPPVVYAAVSTALIVCVVANLASYSGFKVANRKFGQSWAQLDWPSKENIGLGLRDLSNSANYNKNTYYNHWNHVYDALAVHVNTDHRLLLLPSVVFHAPGRRALQTQTYFGDDVIFRIDHTKESLEALIKAKNIRFILWTEGQLRGEPGSIAPYLYLGNWAESRAINLGSELGIGAYDMRQEFTQLTELLRKLGARRETVFAPNTYEGVKTALWQLPPPER